MKRNVQLYIAGQLVDLADDSWILYNWTREDMSNPTAVINSSSHQVTLPGTCRNNGVFGAAFRLDRRTLFGIRYDGTEFDPTRKTPFMLYDGDGTVLESGYCRLDAVNTHNRRHAYTVTLYGGLGSFFYALASKDDGTPRTLADLIWKDAKDDDVTDFGMQPISNMVAEAWDILENGYDENESYFKWWWNVLNFAPAYNGLPDDFDASHALMNSEAYANMPAGVDEDGERGYEYTYKAGLDCALVSFSNPHTEWELCDLRWYLQRPVVSVKAFFAAICDTRNNGGYTVTLDTTFFNDDNPAYASAWWTLSMIASEDRADYNALTKVMAATKSPMDYLVSFCKIYGLLFLWDSARHKVSIVTRATFYADGGADIDLTKRIDRSQQITVDPVLADRKWYQLGDGGKGEFVEQYKRDYGKGYAIQRIDTGYEFDAGTTVLTEGQAFQDAAEVSESDILFSEAARIVNGREWVRYFQLPRFEKVTYELWNDAGESKSYDMACDVEANYWDDPSDRGLDWLPKLQLHGEDNKNQDGADVLVYFLGVKDTPVYSSGSWNVRKSYFLTDDDGAMTDLAGGPCWDLRRAGIQRLALPSFRRVYLSDRYIVESFEWGVPAVRPVPGIVYPTGNPSAIYDRWWKAYLRDRYAVDTAVMTAMVDLRGLPVGQGLLRRFWWYDNALWSLNAIRNHPLTSWDLTECEFVKVQDRRAYTSGPGEALTQYLMITPSATGFTLNPSGETLSLQVKSSSAWSLSLSTAVSWLTTNVVGGSSGTTTLNLTATANTTAGSRRTVNVTLTNLDGETLTFSLMQAAKAAGDLSLSPSSITIPATGTAVEGTASRGRSCRVTASGAWDVDSTTIPAWLTVIKSEVGLTLKAGANSGSARNASIKVYLTGDTSVAAYLAVMQEEGTGGNGGIALLDGNGNSSATVESTGGTLTLYVTIPDGDGWTVASSANWATLSAASGTGNGTLTVTIPSYSGSSDRQATITATRSGYSEGAVFYLIQAAPAASSDYINLTRADAPIYNDTEIDGNGGTIPFDVRASGAWTVTSQSSWLHPQTQYGAWSGSGNATLWVNVDANAGAARTGTIVGTHSVTGETSTFYVYQSGDGTITLDASFNYSSIDSTAQTIYLQVTASSGLAWTIDNVSSGLTPQSYSGTGSQRISVSVSSTTVQRTLSLRVKNTSYSLSATPSITQNAPAATDYIRVTPFGTITVQASETYKDFSIECSTSWQVTTTASGVTFSQSSGSGNGTVRVTFGANSGSARTIPLTFSTTNGSSKTASATISQLAPSSASLSVSPTSLTFTSASGNNTVGVTASTTWYVAVSHSWITATVVNSSQLRIAVSENTGSLRTGTVTVTCGDKTATITVTQAGSSSLEVSSMTAALGSDNGSTAQITVYASRAWDVNPDTIPAWLQVSYPSHAGSANGETLTFTAKSANTTGSSRSGYIYVRLTDDPDTYKEIAVTQAGANYLYVSPTAAQVGNGIGTGWINVRSNSSWHIKSIDDGLEIGTAGQSGTGTKDVNYLYTANPSQEVRRLRVVYCLDDDETKEAMFTVIQAAATAPIQITPDSSLWFQTGEDEGESVLTATRVVRCTADWTAASSKGWLTFSPASGVANTDVTVNFTARGSLTDVLTATWTVTSGNNTKSLSARCIPAPESI